MDANTNDDSKAATGGVLDLDTSTSKEEAIRVCTRMRPLFEKEISTGHVKAWKMQETDMLLIVEPPSMAEMLNARDPNKKGKTKEEKRKIIEKTEGQKAVIQRHYVFDRCFDDNIGNEEVYKILARDIVLDTFKGINGCILAYGQTGSGKTHSVMGVPVDPGMLPRSLAEFFDVIENPSILKEDTSSSKSGDSDNGAKEFLMRVTYLEVYMERVNDLLQEGYKGGAVENLDVKEDPKRGFVVIGIQEETVTSIDEVMLLVAKAEQRRHIAQTNFNETSSRSHTIFTVLLESNQVLPDGTSINKRGELKIVDLAGNERAGRAAEGMENAKTVLEEGKAINKSLFVLSEVISKLSKRAQAMASGDEKRMKKIQEDLVFIPWRDSKLTRILSKSLGGNCRASVIVAVHPSHLYLDTSFSTLRFALKCKTIKKKIEVNFLSPEQSVIMQQKELIAKLQNQLRHLASSKNVDIDLLGTDLKYVSKNKRPEDDEKILALKNELEEKVKKFQNFILKSELHVKSHNNYRALRSIDTHADKSLKYSLTNSANMQNELNWLRSFGTNDYDTKWDRIEKFEDQNTEEKINITKAMDYLKNKSPYKALSSDESYASSDISQKNNESISWNYYNELDELEKLEKEALEVKQKKEKTEVTGKEDGEMLQEVVHMKKGKSKDDQDGEVKKKDASRNKKRASKLVSATGKDTLLSKKAEKSKLLKKSLKSAKSIKSKAKKEHRDMDLKLDQPKKSYNESSNESSDEYKDDMNTTIGKDEVEDSTNAEPKEGGAPPGIGGDEEETKDIDDDTTKQDKLKDEERRTSIIHNLKEKIEEDLKKKKKIYERNLELNKQIKFVMKLMQKVGLSALLTGVVPPGRNIDSVLKLQDHLKDELKLITHKKSSKGILGKLTNTSMDEAVTEVENDKDNAINTYLDYTIDDDNNTEHVETLSHVFINEMFYSFIVRLQQSNTNNNLLEVEDTLKNCKEDVVDVSKKALEEILGTDISEKVDSLEANYVPNRKRLTEEKESKTIDSILNLLTPWEQKILALLYEQQQMRQNVQKVKENFAERIKNINIFIKKILIDKVEVEEHFRRVLETIENYKNNLLQMSDVDSNFKFAGLMKQIENMSILLSEKTRDFNVLAEFHMNLRKKLELKEQRIKQLEEENKLFYLVPKYNDLLMQLNNNNEENYAVKELKREFLLMYGRLILTKKRLEEKEIIEHDIRNVNTKIYTELVESISVIKNLESQYKFLEFKMNNETKKKSERIKKLVGEKLQLNKVINEMEKMLQEANINADGLKNEIIANYELPEITSEIEDEEAEKTLADGQIKTDTNTQNEDEGNKEIKKEGGKGKKTDTNGNIIKQKKKAKKKKTTIKVDKQISTIPPVPLKSTKEDIMSTRLNKIKNIKVKSEKTAAPSNKSIKKADTRAEILKSARGQKQSFDELRIKQEVATKKKKKGSKQKKTKALGKFKKEKTKSNVQNIDDRNITGDTDNSDINYETKEIRQLLNMEIEKKKKKKKT